MNGHDYRRKVLRLTAVVVGGLVIVSMTGLTGCGRAGRHKVLNIFFTGVPPLEESAAPDGGGDGREQGAGEDLPVAGGRTGPFRPRTPFWVHGPYASGNCANCHSAAGSKPFRSFGGGERNSGAGPSFAGARLKLPARQLCVSCHTTFGNSAVEKRDLWLHGPAAAGNCTACHHPHQSRTRYMLLRDNSYDLCTACHDPVRIVDRPAHRESAKPSCLDCHNPHVGRDSLLLRSGLDERATPYD